jgi:hypothetical protein
MRNKKVVVFTQFYSVWLFWQGGTGFFCGPDLRLFDDWCFVISGV